MFNHIVNKFGKKKPLVFKIDASKFSKITPEEFDTLTFEEFKLVFEAQELFSIGQEISILKNFDRFPPNQKKELQIIYRNNYPRNINSAMAFFFPHFNIEMRNLMKRLFNESFAPQKSPTISKLSEDREKKEKISAQAAMAQKAVLIDLKFHFFKREETSILSSKQFTEQEILFIDLILEGKKSDCSYLNNYFFPIKAFEHENQGEHENQRRALIKSFYQKRKQGEKININKDNFIISATVDSLILYKKWLKSFLNEKKMSSENKKLKYNSLTKALILGLLEIQGAIKMIGKKENDRNNILSKFLHFQFLEYENIIVKDQPQWGKSKEGIEAGEVDIKIENKKEGTISIIEALILKSCVKSIILDHLLRVFKYDTNGTLCNYVITYSEAKNFKAFWGKYIKYINTIEFPHEMIKIEKDFWLKGLNSYSDIKMCKTTHDRNGTQVEIIHIAINLYQNN